MLDDDEIGLFEAIYTQRAIRRFRSEHIPRELVTRIVEAATKAPSGGNVQPWSFVVIDEGAQLDRAAEIARANFAELYAMVSSRRQPGDPPPMPNLKRMIDEIQSIPCWIVVCFDPPSNIVGEPQLSSVLPAVQNLLLAARGLNLGAVMTNLLQGSNMQRTKELLGLPDHVVPVACIPIGHPADGVRYGPTSRRPVEEVLHWGTYDSSKTNTAKTAYRAS